MKICKARRFAVSLAMGDMLQINLAKTIALSGEMVIVRLVDEAQVSKHLTSRLRGCNQRIPSARRDVLLDLIGKVQNVAVRLKES